tara:strand:+ start:52 stop:672 length:621 start_codon:yes stop_codon:yes gene_type:complete
MIPYYQSQGITIFHADSAEIWNDLEPFDLILTDPPYGYGWDTKYSRFSKGTADKKQIKNDAGELDLRHIFDSPAEKIIFGFNSLVEFIEKPGSLIVWDKRGEDGFSFLSDGESAYWSEGRGVYIFSKNGQQHRSQAGLHPTQKPIGLFRWCIEKAKRNAIIVDPFMGSGTTLRAAKDLGKRAIGIEIDEKYCETAAKRLEQEMLFT